MNHPKTSKDIPMRFHSQLSLRSGSTRALVTAALLTGLLTALPVRAATPIEQGEALATKGAGAVLACVTCHGAQGQGMATFPYLAGQGEAYLARQLDAFASDTRKNPIMAPIAKAMTAEQKQAVSAYYAQLKPAFDRATLGQLIDTYPDKDDAGAWLANRGDWNNNLPACIQCHAPGGVGVGSHFPAIAGLPAAYLAEQLQAWKSGAREPGPQNLMGDIAKRMSDAQIQAVSAWFANLPAKVQTGATQ